MITLDRVEVECGLVWFGLVWWRFTVFEVDGLVSYITVISPFSFSDRSLRVLVQVLFCRFRSFLPSHLFYCSLLTFFHFHFCHFFFSFTSFLFFFHVLALALVASLCALYKVYLYIPRAFFFYFFSLPLFFTSFFFPPLSLSLSLCYSLSMHLSLSEQYTRE